MKEVIQVCSNCKRKSCDGGIWKISNVVRIRDGKNTTIEVHPDNLEDCTLRWFGTASKYRDQPVGTVITQNYLNWVNPSSVTLVKMTK